MTGLVAVAGAGTAVRFLPVPLPIWERGESEGRGNGPLSQMLRCDTIRYDTIRYDTIRYDTIRYDTIRYDTIRYDTIRYDTIRYDTMRCDAIRYDTVWYGMVWYGMLWYGVKLRDQWSDMVWFLRIRQQPDNEQAIRATNVYIYTHIHTLYYTHSPSLTHTHMPTHTHTPTPTRTHTHPYPPICSIRDFDCLLVARAQVVGLAGIVVVVNCSLFGPSIVIY
jgi:hypothetical protein